MDSEPIEKQLKTAGTSGRQDIYAGDDAWREWFESGHEYGARDKSFLDRGLYDILNFLLIYVKKV